MNEGAKLANDANARRASEAQQDAIIKRLDQVIALLQVIVHQQGGQSIPHPDSPLFEAMRRGPQSH